jgi:glycosidase
LELYYNPTDKKCKSCVGAVKENQIITFNLFYNESKFCNLIIETDFKSDKLIIPMFWNENNGGYYCCEVTFPKMGLFWYYFNLDNKKIGCGKKRNAEFQEDKLQKFQQLVYNKNYKTPDWLNGGIIYQIFPDRFNKVGNTPISDDKILRNDWGGIPAFLPDENNIIKNNDFFGGNLKGIIKKLKYLKSLGITVIYLNPIFEAYSNHRYDTGDYYKIDKLLGTEKDLISLINKAEKLNIKIIIDGVFNHTGDDSVYFNKYGKYNEIGAYQSKKSKYYNWYSFLSYPDVYECWWGTKILPQVNEENKDYINFITGKNGVIEYWLQKGVMGIRLDVADELSDSFLEQIRKAVKRTNKQAFLIGEVWEDATNKISYNSRKKYFQGNELDSVMNYVLKDAIISTVLFADTSFFIEAVYTLIDNYPKIVLDNLMNILGTHDTARILTVFGGKILADKKEMSEYQLSDNDLKIALLRLKFASVFLYTIFGLPCIYYGDEAGLQGFSDPFNRLCYPWRKENKKLIEWFKKLGKIRILPEFKNGEYNELFSDKYCIVYERRKGNRAVTIAVNLGKEQYNLKFEGTLINLLNDKSYNNKFTIIGESVAILYDRN